MWEKLQMLRRSALLSQLDLSQAASLSRATNSIATCQSISSLPTQYCTCTCAKAQLKLSRECNTKPSKAHSKDAKSRHRNKSTSIDSSDLGWRLTWGDSGCAKLFQCKESDATAKLTWSSKYLWWGLSVEDSRGNTREPGSVCFYAGAQNKTHSWQNHYIRPWSHSDAHPTSRGTAQSKQLQ